MFYQEPILEECWPSSLTKILELVYPDMYHAFQESQFTPMRPPVVSELS
jgi:hypothetical protein